MSQAGWDARAAIGRRRGRIRHNWPWYTWFLVYGLPLVIGGGVCLTGDYLAAGISTIAIFVLASIPIRWALRAWRIEVHERAIVMGPFYPGIPRTVHFFQDIDLRTIRAWSRPGNYLRSVGGPRFGNFGFLNHASREGISWVARREWDVRAAEATEDEFTRIRGAVGTIVSTVGGSRRAIRMLALALQAAGFAPAQAIEQQALPPQRLSPEPDAFVHQLPGWPDNRNLHPEDYPPEIVARLPSVFGPPGRRR